MHFADQTTAQRIGLDKVKQRLLPLGPYGKALKQRMPIYGPGCEDQLRQEWDLVASLLEEWANQTVLFQDIEMTVHSLRDIRGIVKKACHGYVLEDVELFEVKRFLELTDKLRALMVKLGWVPVRLKLPELPGLKEVLNAGGRNVGFYLDASYAPGLDKLREKRRQLKAKLSQLKKESQAEITRETGKSFNHQGRLRVNKLEGRLLKQLSDRPELVLAAETYTEVEYVLRDSDAMAQLEREVYEIEGDIEGLEHVARQKLSEQVAADCRRLLAACRRLGRLDLLLAKARLARETGWCVPELVQDKKIELDEFVNPFVKAYLSEQGLSFQALSLSLGSTPVTVITGANMGGKSVSLKSVGLAVAMAQSGLLVPAKAFRLSLRSFVFYSQQDEDPGQGLSTFGAEINSLAAVLPNRNQLGLYLLDEPARGTNPWEGSALVKAIAEWLQGGSSLTLIATHFPGLSDLTGVTHLQVAGLAEADPQAFHALVSEGLDGLNKLMNYALVPGRGEVPRDALKIAGFLGLAPEILAMAAKELGLLALEELKE